MMGSCCRASFDAWKQADQDLSVGHVVVGQIMQETFQGDGSFSPTQSDQLSQVFTQHRVATRLVGYLSGLSPLNLGDNKDAP